MGRYVQDDEDNSEGGSVSEAVRWYIALRDDARIDLEMLELLLDVDMKIEMMKGETSMTENEAIARVFKWALEER